MKILIYGSTFLTEKTCEKLLKIKKYQLVGYIPNRRESTVPGRIPLSIVSENVKCDLRISIQYDSIIHYLDNTFNVHTGLLPEWGGTDILYHTLRKKLKEQGLTFHKITKYLDFGPIISKITYPVFPDDTIISLYERMVTICPDFVATSLKLVEKLGRDNINRCYQTEPKCYKRGQVLRRDALMYNKTKTLLKRKFR